MSPLFPFPFPVFAPESVASLLPLNSACDPRLSVLALREVTRLKSRKESARSSRNQPFFLGHKLFGDFLRDSHGDRG